MVAQEHRPLACLWDIRRLPHDVRNRVTVFGRYRHVDARHQREVECHVAFVAGAEILQHVLRPLIGLGEQQPEIEPEPHHVDNGFEHPRIVEVQIGLVSIKTMPIIGLRHRVPCPVGFLGVDKDDAGFRELLVGIVPKVEVAQPRAGFRAPRALEPGMLVRGMIDDQLGDYPDIAPVRLADKGLEIGHPPIGRIDVLVIRDVVPVVAQRRRIKRQQP